MRATILMVVVILVWARVQAQDPITIAKEAATKVIRAVDLQIQRIQTQTVILQEAQQELENLMSALRLDEIQQWVQDQKDLYGEYFQELAQVKTVISGGYKVSQIIQRQKEILAGYQRGLALFHLDPHFSAAEWSQIETVYGGILEESEKNLEQLALVIESLATQMSDEQRQAIIDAAAEGMDKNFRDLQVFTEQNQLISLQRARDENDFETLKKMYGL